LCPKTKAPIWCRYGEKDVDLGLRMAAKKRKSSKGGDGSTKKISSHRPGLGAKAARNKQRKNKSNEELHFRAVLV